MPTNSKWMSDFIASLQEENNRQSARIRMNPAATSTIINSVLQPQSIPYDPNKFTASEPDYSGSEPWWSRVLDVASRPLYAASGAVDSGINIVRNIVDPNYDPAANDDLTNPLQGVISGFSGTRKTMPDKLIEDAAGGSQYAKNNPGDFNQLKGIGGFAASIPLDPLTYVGGPAARVVSAIKGTTKAGKVVKGLDAAEQAAKDARNAESVVNGLEASAVRAANPATTSAPVKSKVTDLILNDGETVPFLQPGPSQMFLQPGPREAFTAPESIATKIDLKPIDIKPLSETQKVTEAYNQARSLSALSARAEQVGKDVDEVLASLAESRGPEIAQSIDRTSDQMIGIDWSVNSIIGPVARKGGRVKDNLDQGYNVANTIRGLRKDGRITSPDLGNPEVVPDFRELLRASELEDSANGLIHTVTTNGQRNWALRFSHIVDELPDNVVAKSILSRNSSVTPDRLGKMAARAIELTRATPEMPKDEFVKQLTIMARGRGKGIKYDEFRTQASVSKANKELAEAMYNIRGKLVEKNAVEFDNLATAIEMGSKKVAKAYGKQVDKSADISSGGSTSATIKDIASADSVVNSIPNKDVQAVTLPKIAEEVAARFNESDVAAAKAAWNAARQLELPEGFQEALAKIRDRNVRDIKEVYNPQVERELAIAAPDYPVHAAQVENLMDVKLGAVRSITGGVVRSLHKLGEVWASRKSAYFTHLQQYNVAVAKAAKPFSLDVQRAAIKALQMRQIPDGTLDPELLAAWQAFRPFANEFFDLTLENPALSTFGRQGYGLSEINAALKEQGINLKLDHKLTLKAQNLGKTKKQITKIPEAEQYKMALNSWATWDIENPVEFFQKMNAAASTLHLRTSVADQFGALYGAKTPFKGSMKLPELKEFDDTFVWKHVNKDLYFSREAVDNLKLLEKVFTQPNSFAGSKTFMGSIANTLIDPVMAIWKPGMTILRPGHGVRNAISDMLLNVAAGVYSLGHYKDAMTIMKAGNSLPKGVQRNFEEFIKSQPHPVERGSFSITLKGAKEPTQFDAGEMYKMALQDGITPTFAQEADILIARGEVAGGLTKMADRLLATKWMQVSARYNEWFSHFTRIAQYKKLLTDPKFTRQFSTLDDARIAASKEVKRFHPDTTGLTPFEMKYMRRIFPFYSWTKQVLPTIFETMITHPARITAVNKAMYSAGIAAGNQPEGLGNPWPDNLLVPQFMRDQLGYFGGDFAINLGSPTETAADFVNGSPGRNIMGMLNPIAKAPVEMISRQNLQTGAFIPDVGEYVDAQLPGLNQFANISGYSPSGTLFNWFTGVGSLDPQRSVEQGRKEHFMNNSLTNFLTGIQLQNFNNNTYQTIAARGLGRGGN